MSTDVSVLSGPFMTVTGYFEGFQTSFQLPLGSQELVDEALQRALAALNKLKALGFSSAAPEVQALNEGEDKALITSVMRRHKVNDDGTMTPVIDFYQELGRAGKDPSKPFGFSKWVIGYLNNSDDIAAFLKSSGFARLEDIPLYDDDGAPRRSAYTRDNGVLHPKDTRVPVPFYVVRKPNPRKKGDGSEEDKFRPEHIFSRYESADGAAIANSDTFTPADSPAEAALPEQNFHVVLCQVVQGNTGLAYKLFTADKEVIWTNSNEPFVKAGYPVQPILNSIFDFKPPAYIEAVQWPDEKWVLKTGEHSVVKPEPIAGVPF